MQTSAPMTPELLKTEADNCDAQSGLSPAPCSASWGATHCLNADCMDVMAKHADGYFDLAIVDPPYGIGEHGKGNSRHKGGQEFTIFKPKHWDNEPPTAEYFAELKRVSKNQIIWGGNYFADKLTPTMGWVFWDKLIGGDFSDGELAYTSFNRALKKFTHSTFKNRATNYASAQGQCRIHPCQKPVPLYKWLLQNYAQPGQRILDTHMGSGSSVIAALDAGFEMLACEIDAEYFATAVERIGRHLQQGTFAMTPNAAGEPQPRKPRT